MCRPSQPQLQPSAAAPAKGTRPIISAEELARECARCAADKKAEDLIVLDLRGISTFTDYFVICSGTSEPHLKAIASEIQEKLKEHFQVRPSAVDGYPISQWVIMDYLSVLVHVFHAEKRQYYALEDLWGDAPRLELPSEVTAAS